MVQQTLVLNLRRRATYEHVVIEHQPHDCDFMTAPMGQKHCHYQAHVETWGQQPKIVDISWMKIQE
jgi:hypothetical protein